MPRCADGKCFGGVSCNFSILIFCPVSVCCCSLSSSQLNLQKQNVCECAHLRECEVV